ncbi:MAG: CvpA family protein [Candidatus Omnitrophota bacterium]
MISGAIPQFNYLDVLIVIVLIRICCIALAMGLTIEIFKFLGVIFATYISLHYYVSVSDIVQRTFLPKGMPLEFLDFLVFVVLVLAGYAGFAALRVVFYRFIKLESIPWLNKIGGLVLGVIRWFFVVGLLVFTLNISSISYLSNSVRHSYLGSRAFSISPNTYSWLWKNIFSKFSGKEKFNSTVSEAVDKFNQK